MKESVTYTLDKEFESVSNDAKTIIGTLVDITNKLEGRR